MNEKEIKVSIEKMDDLYKFVADLIEENKRAKLLLYNSIILLCDNIGPDDSAEEWVAYILNEIGTTKEELKKLDIYI